MWPSSAMCSGSRSSVQKAIRLGPYSASERQERLQVAGGRAFADQEPHAGAEPLAALLGGVGLVVGADPGGGVGVQRAAAHAGRVTVDVHARAPSFASSCGSPAMTPGKFIISASPITRRRRSRASRSPVGQLPSRRLEPRGRHARGGHEPDVERDPSADVEQPVDAVGPEHVRDLVRVGDDGGRPERQHEPGEFVDEELRRLEVHVRVDEARDDEAPGGVERLAAVVGAEPGDRSVDDGDVDVEPLAREDGEHTAAADDEVGRLVAARDREPARERCSHSGETVQFAPWTS